MRLLAILIGTCGLAAAQAVGPSGVSGAGPVAGSGLSGPPSGQTVGPSGVTGAAPVGATGMSGPAADGIAPGLRQLPVAPTAIPPGQEPAPTPAAGVPLTPEELNALVTAGNAAYMKGDYAACLQALTQAEIAVRSTPPENPLRYDILKRLVSAYSATGEIAMATVSLKRAMDWRAEIFGKDDPKIL